MELDHTNCHQIITAKDARYDGKFFTCVRTTGIYCRPVCPARAPKAENCFFVPSAAAAEEAGFRACLRCRPESAPDLGAWRGTSATVSRALRLIEHGALDDADVETLAGRVGIGERHLRRLFRQHIGATPVSVAQTRRVLLAKQLLHETDLSMTSIAMASGFGSLRRFNETFAALYGKPPSDIRRTNNNAESGLVLFLKYRPPYAWQEMIDFLRLRMIPGIESACNNHYHRLLCLPEGLGLVTVSNVPEKTSLKVKLELEKLQDMPKAISMIRRVFDLGADPCVISDTLGKDSTFKPHITNRPGLRLPGSWDTLEIATRAILGQQVSVKAATTLAKRLVERFGQQIDGYQDLNRLFPVAERLAEADIASLGMPQKRGKAIRAVARLAAESPYLFQQDVDPEELHHSLMELPGIGPWTASYVTMRAAHDTNRFLAGDLVVRKSYSQDKEQLVSARELERISQGWSPWRAYAVMHLWAAA